VKAPFPWFGGKRKVAHEVWRRFGDVDVYAEPFAGSLAVLLGRPTTHTRRVETVNDLDGFVSNAWRAILHDPTQTAGWASWPVNECDLHARHAWLTERRADLRARLEGDPDYYDAKIAGWWLWCIACWIGGEMCSGKGPWHRVEVAPGDWQLIRDDREGDGVTRKLIQLGNAGRGVNRGRIYLASAGQGVIAGRDGLVDWLTDLSCRLRRVRVACGDWARVVTPSAMAPAVGGVRGIFLDPPYSAEAGRDSRIYSSESLTVAHDVLEWCKTAPTEYRIALCGYEDEGHEDLEAMGWDVYKWCANGGMSNERGKGSGGNNERERIWFSPACIDSHVQRGIFDGY
jgi:hypothetical protein